MLNSTLYIRGCSSADTYISNLKSALRVDGYVCVVDGISGKFIGKNNALEDQKIKITKLEKFSFQVEVLSSDAGRVTEARNCLRVKTKSHGQN